MATTGLSLTCLSPERFALVPEAAIRRAGLIALATDLTSERDAAAVLPTREIGLHVTRVAYENPTTPDNLRRMVPRLGEAAALLAPGSELAAIYYACTSASVVIGDEAVEAAIWAVRPGTPVITPTRAAKAAFAALGIRRIALVTPYVEATTAPMIDYFAAGGVAVASALCFGFDDDRAMARIGRESLVEAVLAAGETEADAVFLSCTALPSLGVIVELEARLNRPVVASNQAGYWMMRHCLGLTGRVDGFGRLFDHSPAATRPAMDVKGVVWDA
ncbi:ectoine utilization protein EutA [Amorphus sp. 3PC139-8]|uniref:aspartate racemase/maleate isomerase family protein n=1 Tax=Amorphus sp. 3PC139-8 TaxID=2735676 RepID=UPI00345D1BB3